MLLAGRRITPGKGPLKKGKGNNTVGVLTQRYEGIVGKGITRAKGTPIRSQGSLRKQKEAGMKD